MGPIQEAINKIAILLKVCDPPDRLELYISKYTRFLTILRSCFDMGKQKKNGCTDCKNKAVWRW